MLKTRKEAVANGDAFYFTGNPCAHGHIDRRRLSNNRCVSCEREANRAKSEYKKQWYEANKSKILASAAKRYEENKDEKLAYASEYQKKNLKKIIASRKLREMNDEVYALKERVRGLIKESIKKSGSKKKSRTSEILGCSTLEFKLHIERQFVKGMCWDNFGEWHLDHIVPISSAKTEDDVVSLNHHTNLRPMWAADNIRKSNKMEFLL